MVGTALPLLLAAVVVVDIETVADVVDAGSSSGVVAVSDSHAQIEGANMNAPLIIPLLVLHFKDELTIMLITCKLLYVTVLHPLNGFEKLLRHSHQSFEQPRPKNSVVP